MIACSIPIPTSAPLKVTATHLRKTTCAAVYPLFVGKITSVDQRAEENVGQGFPRPQLHTRRPASPDPWGIRAGHPPRPRVERHDRLLGDADLRASALHRRRRPRRPLLP